jgi:hypothetical protein
MVIIGLFCGFLGENCFGRKKYGKWAEFRV